MSLQSEPTIDKNVTAGTFSWEVACDDQRREIAIFAISHMEVVMTFPSDPFRAVAGGGHVFGASPWIFGRGTEYLVNDAEGDLVAL